MEMDSIDIQQSWTQSSFPLDSTLYHNPTESYNGQNGAQPSSTQHSLALAMETDRLLVAGDTGTALNPGPGDKGEHMHDPTGFETSESPWHVHHPQGHAVKGSLSQRPPSCSNLLLLDVSSIQCIHIVWPIM